MSEQKYYALGAYWNNSEDKTEEFVKQGRWENGYDDKFVNSVNAVEVGARVAIKSKFTGGEGHKTSITKIKAIGTVTKNFKDGKNLKINWDKNFECFEYNGGGYWKAVSRIRNKDYINKTFFHGKTNIEERIARVTWNTEGWIKPSGRNGKSKNKVTHEGEFGFGHEEWLFDTGKLINGYHYGFLEPINKQQQAFENGIYNVWLYTIDEKSKKRYWVGCIKRLEVLNQYEAEKAYSHYQENNWLIEMQQQLKRVVEDNKVKLAGSSPIDIFNVRFRLGSTMFNSPIIELPESHPVAKVKRYNFGYFSNEYKANNIVNRSFQFTASSDSDIESGAPKKKSYERKSQSVEITYLHKAISNELTKYLRVKYGKSNVAREHSDYQGGRIDAVVNDNGNITFYEIKTYNSLKASIREAIGQLLEYSMWTNSKNAGELVIVTQPHSDIEDAKKYMKHIRKTYNISLFYQIFDLETNRLSEKY
jgi:hypothetical protein